MPDFPGFSVSSGKDDLPLGTVLQSPTNLEYITNKRWRALNGQTLPRSAVHPYIGSLFPMGVPSTTGRSMSQTPLVPLIAAGTTNFVACGQAGATTFIQYSTDGITWSTTTVNGVAFATSGIFWIGNRWLCLKSGTSLGPEVTTGDVPNATWATLTTLFQPDNATAPVQQYGAAYSPSLALTVILAATQTTVYSLPDGGTADTARTVTSRQNTSVGIVWTGSVFLIVNTTLGVQLQTSTNGTTSWVDVPGGCQGFSTVNARGVVSDGAGTVVIAFPYYFLVSNDHGVTWGKVFPPIECHQAVDEAYTGAIVPIFRIFYTGGRFIATTGVLTASGQGILASLDGYSWHFEPILRRAATTTAPTAGTAAGVAQKGTVLAGIYTTNTAAFSASIDETKLRLPATARSPEITTLQQVGFSNYQEYMKVLP